MAADSISVISLHDAYCKEEDEVDKKNLSSKHTESPSSLKTVSYLDEIRDDAGTVKVEATPKSLGKIIAFAIATIALSILPLIPWTTIPRTNSIIYQSSWLEVLLPTTTYCFLAAAAHLLCLTVWTQERSMVSTNIFLRMFVLYMTTLVIFYVLSHLIWSVHLGYNHPLPFLRMVSMPISIVLIMALWFLLPSNLMKKEDFRRKIRMYTVYFLCNMTMISQNEVLSNLFTNIPSDFQFVVALIVAACRELDKRVRSKIVTKMMGKLDEPAAALLTIFISSFYGFFMAVRLTGSTLETICCFLFVDQFLHSRATFKIIRQYKRVKVDHPETRVPKNDIEIAKLIIAELVEGMIPLIYGIGMAMAYYGPNAKLFINIGSSFWGEPIDDITEVFKMMLILFLVDTMGAAINSICLWKMINLSVLQEFAAALSKYWRFMVIQFGFLMSTYLSTSDVNFGVDSSGKFEWITPEGRLNLIFNSTDLTNEEKSMLFVNTTLN